MEKLPEYWLRGPVEGVPPLLQPVAHALLQAAEEIRESMTDFSDRLLWSRPAGAASVGFHLLHIAGVLSRMCTYAQAQPLSEAQFDYLRNEGLPQEATVSELVSRVEAAVGDTIAQLKTTAESSLTQARSVGRKGLPSTVVGLLFHAAEHTTRHTGQLLVTAAVVKADANSKQ